MADGAEVRGLLVGGLSTDQIADTTTYFTQAQDYRRRLGDLPDGRFLHAAEPMDGLIYLFGGRNFTETRAVWAFDPETGRYADETDLPSLQNGLASVAYDGALYAIGGANGFGVAVATVRKYDPDARTWTDLRAMPTGRKDLAAVVVGDEIWAVGGDNNGPLQTVEIYTPATNTWRAGTALPAGRAGVKAIQRDGVVYVVGGLGANGAPIGDVLHYQAGAWVLAFSGAPVAYAQVALIGDSQLDIFGGRGAAGPSNVPPHSRSSTRPTWSRPSTAPRWLRSTGTSTSSAATRGSSPAPPARWACRRSTACVSTACATAVRTR